MTKRKGISKKVRFEVFKRDKFKCQYCGSASPDVILEVDHITPVAHGGENEILNYITSCRDCNAGKKDRELSDDSVLTRQRRQMEEIQERREQIKLLAQWRKDLDNLDAETVGAIENQLNAMDLGYDLNEQGKKNALKWVRRFGLAEVQEAVHLAFTQYIKRNEMDMATGESWDLAWSKVPAICQNRRTVAAHPELADVPYILGILRNRGLLYNYGSTKTRIIDAIQKGVPSSTVKLLAIDARNWTVFRQDLEEATRTPAHD